MTHRTEQHFLEDILKAIESINSFVSNMSFEDFEQDLKTLRAVEREFEIIGEAVKKLPPSITSHYPNVPWRSIAGMRDRLIHHYWATESEILWKTIEEFLPELKNIVLQIIKQS